MSNMQETIGGGIMMYVKITHQELESILLNKFHSEFVQRCKKFLGTPLKDIEDFLTIPEFVQRCKNFLATPKTDYYCYGYMPDAQYLEISMEQLKEILSHNVISPSFYTLNAIYQAGKITGQSSVYLYGRNRA